MKLSKEQQLKLEKRVNKLISDKQLEKIKEKYTVSDYAAKQALLNILNYQPTLLDNISDIFITTQKFPKNIINSINKLLNGSNDSSLSMAFKTRDNGSDNNAQDDSVTVEQLQQLVKENNAQWIPALIERDEKEKNIIRIGLYHVGTSNHKEIELPEIKLKSKSKFGKLKIIEIKATTTRVFIRIQTDKRFSKTAKIALKLKQDEHTIHLALKKEKK